MRTLVFTAGLGAATLSFATEIHARDAVATDRITLTNGCIYAPNLLVETHEWTLTETPTGTATHCPLKIYGRSFQPSAAPAPLPVVAPPADPVVTQDYVARAPVWTPPVTRPQRQRRNLPHYLVGVFR